MKLLWLDRYCFFNGQLTAADELINICLLRWHPLLCCAATFDRETKESFD